MCPKLEQNLYNPTYGYTKTLGSHI